MKDDVTRRGAVSRLFSAAIAPYGGRKAVGLNNDRNISKLVVQQKRVIRLDDWTSFRDDGAYNGGNQNEIESWDGTDNSSVIQAALAQALSEKLATILVPINRTGLVCFDTALVSGELPVGLTIEMEGMSGTTIENFGGLGSSLIWRGPGTAFNIKYLESQYGGPQAGWHVNLTFNGTYIGVVPSATMFDFNEASTNDALDPDNSNFVNILNVSFENCRIYKGGTPNSASTGDGIRANKLFQLHIGRTSHMRGWRRAIWTRNCDVGHISPGRLEGNGRHVMIQGYNSFGNDINVDVPFLGYTFDCGEERCVLWDEGNGTKVRSCEIEDTNSDFLLYLNGRQGHIEPTGYAGLDAPWFKLGPNAREYTMDTPHLSQNAAVLSPVIETAFTNDFGFSQQDYRINILNASMNAQFIVGNHERINWVNPAVGRYRVFDARKPVKGGQNGLSQKAWLFNSLNIQGQTIGTIGNDGISRFVSDSDVAGERAWLLEKNKLAPGVNISLVCGRDFQPGDLMTASIRCDISDVTGWGFFTTKNDKLLQFLTLSNTIGYHYFRSAIVGMFQKGDVLSINVAKIGQANVNFKGDFILVYQSAPAIENVSITPVKGVDGTGNNSASLFDTNARFVIIEDKLNAIIDNIKTGLPTGL